MDFVAVMEQVIALLRQRGRVTYRTLQIQFTLDDEQLAALKDELLYSQPQVTDDAGRGLVWAGDPGTAPAGPAAPVVLPAQSPLAYIPPYLAEKIFTARLALAGERKQVTVLFADLKDSTELIRGLDPEAAQQLLDPAIQRMMDALRACYAALAMQAAMRASTEEVRRTRGLELRMRVGINSGEVVVRAIGNDLHMDYSAIGETTHLAARMEQLA